MNQEDPLVPLGDGHTPLDEDDRRGLKLSYITTRGDLNEAEQANILKVRVRRRPPSARGLLDDLYLRELHRDMFGDVWSWAGTYRRFETSIGVDPSRIATSVRNLVEDSKMWIAAGSESPQALAVRFHHELVRIHPFPNGNGRHGRMASDYLLMAFGQPPFTGGATWKADVEVLRSRHLEALRRADGVDLEPMQEFATH